MGTLETKRGLRLRYRRLRKQLSKAQARAAGHTVAVILQTERDWSSVATLHTYLAMDVENEISTWPFLHWLWENHPHIQTFGPVVDAGRLVSVSVSEATTISDGYLGTPRPQGQPYSGSFDVIIIPCLAGDRDHYRLGLGGGYYDRFLSQNRSAYTIGLCYRSAIVRRLPREKHDISLDRIITETGPI